MNLLSFMSDTFFNYNSFFYWRDLLEIFFFTTIFYYVAIWLKKDKQKNLLPYFYGYCVVAFAAHYSGLTTISYTLFLFAPVTSMIFIFIHQDLLQRNIISLKNITPAKRIHLDWLETLIRTIITNIDDKKTITCVIEQSDSIQDFIETSLQFNAEVKEGLLNILLNSPTFNQNDMIWVNTHGQLVGVNASWKKIVEQEKTDQNIKKLSKWKEQAIFFSAKTDAIILHISGTNRTFDIVLNGMIIDKMHVTKTIDLIKKYILSKPKFSQGATKYEKIFQKSVSKQRST